MIKSKNFRVAQQLLRANMSRQLSYPNSFIFAIISKVGRMAVILIFFQAIFLHTTHIGTWNHQDILFVVATYLTFESLIVITYHRNLAYYLQEHLRKGTFDRFLIQPMAVLPHVAFEIIDFMDLISAVFVAGLWAYIGHLHILHITLTGLALFIITCLCAVLFTFSMSTIIAAVSFFSLTPTGLGRLYEQFFRLGRYPADGLGGGPSFILTYLVPFAIIGTIPASALRSSLSPITFIGTAGTVLVFFLMSRALWKAGLKKYSSASS